MTRILLVVPRLAYPAVSGGELRVLSLIAGLKDRYSFRIASLLPHEDPRRCAAAALALEDRLVERVHLWPRGPAQAPAGGWRLPDFVHWYQNAGFGRELRALVLREGVDLVHFEFSEMAQYAPCVSDLVPTVFTEHDAGLLSLRRSHLRRGETWLDWRRYWQWACRWSYEARALRSCDRVVALSPADARRLSRLARPGAVRVVPTGVDLEGFAFRGPEGRRADELVFVGHYPHYPNEDAALHLCRDILPRLRALRPAARLRLVGSDPTPAVRALAGDAVTVEGTVPDVRPYLWRAAAFIAPVRLGHGIKGKLLEAFAAGIPVAASPESCEAMPGLVPGRHLLVGRGPRELARAAAALLGDPALGARLAREARAYAERLFGWGAQAGALDAVYREALALGGGRRR